MRRFWFRLAPFTVICLALAGCTLPCAAEIPSDIRSEIVRAWKLSETELRAEFHPMKGFLHNQALAFKGNGAYGGNRWRQEYGNEIDILVILSAVAKEKYPHLREFDLDARVWNSIPGKTRLNHRWVKFAEQCHEWVRELLQTAQLVRALA